MDNQLKQANMMVARSKKELGTPEVVQTVAIPIPLFDRGDTPVTFDASMSS
jgi:hypothetical protein